MMAAFSSSSSSYYFFFFFFVFLFCLITSSVLRRTAVGPTAVGPSEVEPFGFLLDSTILEKSERFSMSYYVNSLKNKRIVFMGDSVTRYQYIALIYSLSEGQYLQSSLCPNPVNEKTYDGWYNFFNNVSTSMKPIEYCDCFRFNWGFLLMMSKIDIGLTVREICR